MQEIRRWNCYCNHYHSEEIMTYEITNKPRIVTTDWLHDPNRWGHNHQSLIDAKQYQKWKNGHKTTHKRGRSLTVEQLTKGLEQGPASCEELAIRVGATCHCVRHLIQGGRTCLPHTKAARRRPQIYWHPEQVPRPEEIEAAIVRQREIIQAPSLPSRK